MKALAGARGARTFDLGKSCRVGITQHEADVGMRDQASLGVDHVSLPVVAYLDCETTSQISLRLTSATLTPASRRVPASASVMYGSDSRRK